MKTDTERIIGQVAEFARRRGAAVYLVGGYLRDLLLRRTSKDMDFTMETDALVFARLFAETFGYPPPIFYGRFGTAMTEKDGVKLEFATCRRESYAEDSRKPSGVTAATIHEDLMRRDFTINCIAKNLSTGEILDPFDGRKDLKEKVIRTPVDPDRTFHDDPLRILRGIRFSARLSFRIEEKTFDAMKRNVHRLEIVSGERIADEILQMLQAPLPSRGFVLLDAIGALEKILPEIATLKEKKPEHPCKELFPHTLKALDNISAHTKNVYLRLAMLLHDIGKPKTLRFEHGKVSFHAHEFVGEKMAYRVCGRLHIGAEETKLIGRLIRFHLRPHLLAKENPTDKGLRRFIREIRTDLRPLFTLAMADLTTQNEGKFRRALAKLAFLRERVVEINRKDRIATFKLAVGGDEIMRFFDIPPGKAVGIIKTYIEEQVIEGVLPNKKRPLRAFLKEKGVFLREMTAGMVQFKKGRQAEGEG